MEAVHTIWNFFLLFALLAFSQLTGVLLFFRLRRFSHFLAHISGFIVPILLSVGFLWMIFIYRYYKFHPDEREGLQLMAAFYLMILAAIGELLVGAVAQIALHSRVKGCRRKRGEPQISQMNTN
jgi:hypothetical protein